MTTWIKINEDNTVDGAYSAPANISIEEQEVWVEKEYGGNFVHIGDYVFFGDITQYVYDPENNTFIAPPEPPQVEEGESE